MLTHTQLVVYVGDENCIHTYWHPLPLNVTIHDIEDVGNGKQIPKIAVIPLLLISTLYHRPFSARMLHELSTYRNALLDFML